MNTIRDFMTVDVETVQEEKPLSDIIRSMADIGISCVVVTKDDKPLGIITERDLVKKVLSKNTDPSTLKAKDVMSSPVISINPDIEFGDALGIMDANNVRRLVVVENKILVGLITSSDIVQKTKVIDSYNKKLTFYQNIQSYVIFAFFIFVVLYLIIRYLI